MPDDTSALNLADDLGEICGLEEAKRWIIDHTAPLEILAKMSPQSQPQEIFQLRLLWVQYPELPPSLKFRDPHTGSLSDPKAWPKLPGFRPESLDACVTYCSEGMALHPEWRTDPKYKWDSKGNVLLKVLRWVQDEFDEHFSGRFGK